MLIPFWCIHHFVNLAGDAFRRTQAFGFRLGFRLLRFTVNAANYLQVDYRQLVPAELTAFTVQPR